MSTPYGLASMFAECALPGCPNPVVEWGQVCLDCVTACVTACGPYLQPCRPDQPPITEEVLAERDAGVAAANRMQVNTTTAAETSGQGTPLAGKGSEVRKQNQRCWLCQERRTCTQTRQGWECDRCQAITGWQSGPGPW